MSDDPKKETQKGWLSRLFAPYARWRQERNKPSLKQISTYVFCYNKTEEHEVSTSLFGSNKEMRTFKWPSSIRLSAELIAGTNLYALNIQETVRKGDNTQLFSNRFEGVSKKAVTLDEAVTALKKWEEDAMVSEKYDRIASYQPYTKVHYSRHLSGAEQKAKASLIRLKPEERKP